MINANASPDEVLSAEDENEECDDRRILTDREKYNMVIPVLLKIGNFNSCYPAIFLLLISVTLMILKCQVEEAKDTAPNLKALKYHSMIQPHLMEMRIQLHF